MELYRDCNYMGFNIWELHRIWKTPTYEQDIGQQGQTEMVRLRKQNQSQELPLIETKKKTGFGPYQLSTGLSSLVFQSLRSAYLLLD